MFCDTIYTLSKNIALKKGGGGISINHSVLLLYFSKWVHLFPMYIKISYILRKHIRIRLIVMNNLIQNYIIFIVG